MTASEPMDAPRRNIECKASDPNPAGSLEVCRALGNDAEVLRAALTAAVGTTVVVCKTRRLFLWRHVRIHLDVVERLGSFIEIEAVAPAGSDLADEYALVQMLRERLGIIDERLIANGYAEQLRALDSSA